MLDLFIGLKRVIKRRIVHIDNGVFRLHWLFTSIMLISCSLIVTSRQYVGDPIDCLQTDDIPSSVLNTYCWIHSTYTIPSAFDKIVGVEVAHPGIERSRGRTYEDALENALNQQTTTLVPNSVASLYEVNTEFSKKKQEPVRNNNRNLFRSTKYRKYYTYYQRVCFALFIQAILFYLPYFIWKLWEGGLLHAITLGMQLTMISNEERDRKRKILNDFLYSHLRCHRLYAYKYFFCEFLCFANVTGQFFLTDWFFDGEFFHYGIKVLRYAKHDPSLSYDPSIFIFPRMTKCTFHSYGFSGDVQRHDALCMLTLNVVNEKIYIFIWFWLALLWILLIFVLAYRIIILFAWKWRGYFLTKRCTLSYFTDLDYICRNGNIGDWFLLYMLGSNLDPLLMREVTDNMATRMREENAQKFQDKQQAILNQNSELRRHRMDQMDKNLDLNQKEFDLSCHIGMTGHRPVKSSAPPAHHFQFTNSQYLNQNFNDASCPNTQLQENINLANKMKCNECSHQLMATKYSCENTTYGNSQVNRDDEFANLIDNQVTIAANHCLKDKCSKKIYSDQCLDRQNTEVDQKKSSRSKSGKVKIKQLVTTASRQLKCIKPNSKNKTSTNSNQTNATELSMLLCNSSRESRCTNDCCFNDKSNLSETSSLANSGSSGLGLDFESKLNDESNSENEQTICEQEHSQSCSQSFSPNKTSGYQSNFFSNCSNKSTKSNRSNDSANNNSDTLDQISSLGQVSSFEKTSSPEQATCSNNESSKQITCAVESTIEAPTVYKKNRRKSSTLTNSRTSRLISIYSNDDSICNNKNNFTHIRRLRNKS